MEILKLLPLFYVKFTTFMLISARMGAFFYAFILFKHITASFKLITALTLIASFYVLMLTNQNAHFDTLSMALLVNMIIQSLIGIVIAFILNTVFEVFLFAGQLISTQMGLSIAALIDPRYGMITSLSQFYLMTSMMLFFMLNGHVWMIKILIESFQVIGIGSFDPHFMLKKAISFTSIIFSSSLMLAIIVIIVNLLINISIALISKFSPQFNIFTIGIGIQLIMGFVLLLIIFQMQLNEGKGILLQGFDYVNNLLRPENHVR